MIIRYQQNSYHSTSFTNWCLLTLLLTQCGPPKLLAIPGMSPCGHGRVRWLVAARWEPRWLDDGFPQSMGNPSRGYSRCVIPSLFRTKKGPWNGDSVPCETCGFTCETWRMTFLKIMTGSIGGSSVHMKTINAKRANEGWRLAWGLQDLSMAFAAKCSHRNHVLCDSDSLLRELRVLACLCSPIRRMTVSATYFLNRAMTKKQQIWVS